MADVRPAYNLRELYERIKSCLPDSIYHHFCETPLRISFDDPEFRNDFAAWSRRSLNDDILAEKLGILDPYDFEDIEEIRKIVLDIIDDRLSEISHVPWAKSDQAFHFLQALTVVFDTGRQLGQSQKSRREGRVACRRVVPTDWIHGDEPSLEICECGEVLQPSWHGRAMDQGGQIRFELDATLLS